MAMDMATLGIKVDATDVTKASVELDKLSTAGGKTAQSMSAVEKATKGLTGLFAGIGAGMLAKEIIDVNREFQTLRTSLITTAGSAEKAGIAFKFIQDFAAKTPFDVQQVTTAFIRLGNLGLKPSEEALRSYGNTAAAQAKPIMQMIEAVADATTGEFERLKEFGIKAKVQGDNVNFIFQGVTTEVKNNAKAIEGYLVGLGNTKFGDAMSNQSKTMNGAISNLGDTWSAFMDNILNDARENMIAKWVQTAGEALHWLDVQMNGAIKSADKLAEVDNRLAANRASLNAHNKNGAVGSLVDDLTGYDPAVVKNQIESDIKLREKLTGVIAGEKVEQDKLIQSMSAQTAATGTTTSNKKEQEKAAKAAARAEASLAKTYEDTITSLNLHNIELSKTPRELEEATLVSKKFTKAMIEQALAAYDIGRAMEAKKKLIEDEKSEMDSLIDRYNKATLSARDYYATTLTTTGTDGQKIPIPAQDKAPILAQFDKTTGAEAAKKAQEDAKTTLDAYNKALDDAKTKTQDLGGITTAIFDGALGGISLMTGALTAMTDSLAENAKAMDELNKNQLLNNSIADPKEKAANFKKYAKEEAALNAKNVQDQMTGTRQVAMAASKMFSEKSAGAKAFHALSVSIDIAQQAMRIKDMAMSAVATAKNIAEGASKMFAQSGWLGFAGVAAMLALMAGLGAMSKGGGGSSTPPPTDTGTGTVLGDPTAVSESISKTNDLLKNIHASEYVELRGINRGVNNLQAGITKTVDNLFQKGGMSTFQVDKPHQLESIAMTLLTGGLVGLVLNKLPVIGSIMSGISNFLFGGKVTQSIVAQGIGTNKTSLSDVINGGNVKAYQFADIKTHTSGGLFGSSSDSYSTQTQKVSKDVQESLNRIFSSIGKTMLSVGKTLGDSIGKDLGKVVLDASIPAMRIDLMGLNGEKAAKKVNGVISATLDKMSTKMFGDIVGKYQQLGEGMLQTTIRIVSEIAIVKDALDQSGLKLLKDDVIGVSDAIVQAAGGLEGFQKLFEDYYDKFYTDAEKQARLQTRLTDTMKEAFLVLPETRDGYRKLVEGLNMTNPLDQQRYSLLLELSSAADTYYSMLEKGAEKVAAIAKTQRSLDIQYMELTGDAVGALTEKRKDELAAMDESLRLTQRSIYVLTDANKAVTDATTAANKAVTDAMALASKAVSAAVNDVSKAISNLSSLAQKLRGALTGNTISTDATTRKDRADAQAVLNAALIVANASGSIDNFAGMDKALTDISKPSEQLYTSFTDYARDQALTSNTITQLADYADAQVSMAQQQIDAINNTTNAVNSVVGSLANLTEAQKTLATVEDQKAQIDKMLSNNMAVLSVGEAVTNLALALNAQNEATQKIAVAQAAAKAEAAAELKMNDVKKKAEGSSQNLADANAEKKRMEDALYNANLNIEYIAVRAEVTRLTAKYQASPSAASSKAVNDYLISVGSKFNEKYNPNPNVAADKMWTLSPNYRGDGSYSLPGAGTQTIAEANATALSISSLANAIAALIPSLSAISSTDTLAASEAYKEFIIAKEKAAKAAADLPAFASGGQHEGGWRIVGENGPELEKTGASRIFSNPQSKSLLNMDELIAEIKSLRSDVRAGQQAIANNTLRTAKILRDVTQDGTAITTVVAA